MANLSLLEIGRLERLLKMGDDHPHGAGYVLDFTNPAFAGFFKTISVDITDPKYTTDKPSGSKANIMRGFWEQESNAVVGYALSSLIDKAEDDLGNAPNGMSDRDKKLIAECREIVARLTGKSRSSDATDGITFLFEDVGAVDVDALGLEANLAPIIKERLDEAKICLANGANLAAIFMVGSVLEALLLGEARKRPEAFNRTQACPKNSEGKSKQFCEWTLANFIDVARELGLLGKDVSNFSSALRDFRNYIHPHQQMADKFSPDKDTAEMCFRAMRAAIRDLNGRRSKS